MKIRNTYSKVQILRTNCHVYVVHPVQVVDFCSRLVPFKGDGCCGVQPSVVQGHLCTRKIRIF
jgi:hypothetical protein